MKIDCVLTSCNLNKNYTDFIPLFIKAWNYLYPNIDVKIILICNKIPKNLIKFEKNLIQFNEIDGIYSSFISQYIRILYPAILNYQNGILITDIDMIPMNNKYYTQNIENISNDKFITYRNRKLDKKNLVICYNCSLSKTWSDIFHINNKNDVIVHIKNIYKRIKYTNKRLKKGWYTDQLQLYKHVNKWNNKTNKHIILKDEKTKFNRLCRKSNFILNQNIISNIKKGNYSEYHAYSPYEEYKEINDNIIKILTKK